MNKLVRSFIRALALVGTLTLVACGGGGGDNQTGPKPFDGNGGGAPASSSGGGGGGATAAAPVVPPPPTAGVASLVLTLADPVTGATTTAVPAVVRAIVRDAAGVAVPNAVVTFSVATPTLATLVPASGTALTDGAGTATVRMNAATLSAAGATTVSASSQVAGAAVNGSIGFAIGAANVTIGGFTFGTGATPLSAFGTTSASVTVLSGGTPVAQQIVTFSSPCASSGKAVLTPSVLTSGAGVALASYRDNGCGANDTITASVSGLASATGSLAISVPSAGSIQFVSATPTNITLKGTGGALRQETSQVIFKVVDTGGNPLSASQSVSFTLSTSVGGITFANGATTTTATSDPTTGQAVVTVQAGTVATPVRVLARTVANGVTLSTQSDQLTITTGIPDQQRFSVSATQLNIEGLRRDGETSILTARLADHFGNPVPDGTAVNFISEAAAVLNATTGLGSCTTTNGECAMTLRSQGTRPANGRVTVLAYAVGEETFTDRDGDGLADLGAELTDVNSAGTDLTEAFVDTNENGIRDAGETFIDFGGGGAAGDVPNGLFDLGDGKYNGVLCNETAGSTAGTCSTQKSIHVRQNMAIVFSGSVPFIDFYTTALAPISPVTGIAFSPCVDGTPYTPAQTTVVIVVKDENGNAMAAGTSISFSTTNGTITSTPTTFTVPSISNCLVGSPGCPASAAVPILPVTASDITPLTYRVGIRASTTQDTATRTCSTANAGFFTVTVTVPSGLQTTQQLPITN